MRNLFSILTVLSFALLTGVNAEATNYRVSRGYYVAKTQFDSARYVGYTNNIRDGEITFSMNDPYSGTPSLTPAQVKYMSLCTEQRATSAVQVVEIDASPFPSKIASVTCVKVPGFLNYWMKRRKAAVANPYPNYPSTPVGPYGTDPYPSTGGRGYPSYPNDPYSTDPYSSRKPSKPSRNTSYPAPYPSYPSTAYPSGLDPYTSTPGRLKPFPQPSKPRTPKVHP